MATFKSYITGFILSVLGTLGAYYAVINGYPHAALIIFTLAILQLFVQLRFFLHLGTGPDSRMNGLFFLFALAVVGIVVGGSLWIMSNLNYNMTPAQMNASMLDQAE